MTNVPFCWEPTTTMHDICTKCNMSSTRNNHFHSFPFCLVCQWNHVRREQKEYEMPYNNWNSQQKSLQLRSQHQRQYGIPPVASLTFEKNYMDKEALLMFIRGVKRSCFRIKKNIENCWLVWVYKLSVELEN